MSIAGDLLTTATPARLLCRRGTWILELVRLVPIERNVFQPRVQRLEGADAVLQYLKRTCDSPALAAAASQLMRARPEEDRHFEAVDGEWVPAEPVARHGSVRPSAPPPGNASELSELRAELLVLRASHERLRERVQQLEARNSKGAPAREVFSSSTGPTAAVARALEAQRAPEPLASTLLHGQTPSPLENGPARAQAELGLRLPHVDAINACLASLIGESAAVRDKRPVRFSESEVGACWLSRLIDDEGREVGAIVADRDATATLGGALMALSEHEIEAQRGERGPSADVVGAMGEVANQLCETINQERPTGHVRVKPVESLVPGLLDWTRTAADALELELAESPGRLFLFTR